MTTPGLLCVHPHPDDESIAVGGSIARYLDEGLRVKVVTCTRGEAGDNLAGIELDGEDMVTVRERELAAALDELGGPQHEYLGYRDSGMAGTPRNHHPDAFAVAALEEAAGRLASIIRRFRPAVVVSDNAEGTYGHPDHVKANRVTVRAVELAADPSWNGDDTWEVAKRYVVAFPRGVALDVHRALLEQGLASPFADDRVETPEDLPFGTPDEEVTTVVDVGAWLGRKRAALRAHRSQVGPDSFFLNVPDDVAARFFGLEAFTWGSGRIRSVHGEHDLFQGVR
ncbi:MAG: PIG-L family deacetylase [Actinobacteria bacterium]|nr:PIG-L family deacetylase [Actinomycetota bacterium]